MRRLFLLNAMLMVVLFVLAGCNESAKSGSGADAGSIKSGTLPEKAPVAAPPQAKQESLSSVKPVEAATPKVKPGSSSASRMTFENTFHDFGEISPSSSVSCAFKFTNTGKALLKVNSKLDTTCGCTVPTLEKTDYAPGESGVVNVTFKANATPSEVTKRVTVHSDDPESPSIKLTIKAKIVQQVDCTPKVLKLMMKDENAGCEKITIKSLDGTAFKITSFKSIPQCISLENIDALGQAAEFVLSPKVDTSKISGGVKGRIEIGLDHPKCDKITINFDVLQRFSTSKRSIVVMKAEPGKSQKNELWFFNNYNEDFELDSVTSQKGYIKVLSQEKIGNRYKIELEITPPAIEGAMKFFSDNMTLKVKNGEEVKVGCFGYYATSEQAGGTPAK